VHTAPDIILIAKAIASGFPMSATIGKAELMDPEVNAMAWRPGAHGSTFGGNPVIAAAGIASLNIIEKGLMKNAAEVGGFLKEKMTEIMNRHRIIGEVRGMGLMIGIELVQDRATKQPFPQVVSSNGKNIKEVITGECFKRGLILYGAGVSSLRISPPLVITQDDAKEALNIIEEVITDVEGQLS
jgi:4-aminobutyrate aminotransferase